MITSYEQLKILEADKPPRTFVRGLPTATALLAGAYALAGGAITLAGWALNIPRFMDWGNTGISMKANAAVCAFAAGIVLVTATLAPGRKWPIRIPAALVAMTGLLTMLEHLTGWNFGLDTLLFNEPPGAMATVAPGRMGVFASTSFAMLGAALLMVTGSPRARRRAAGLGIVVVGIAALPLIGYFYHASQLYTLPRLTGIALQTASMIAALGIGLIAATPEHGLPAALRRDDAGGMILRRLILPIILLPLVVGWLLLRGQQAGLYDAAFGTAARTLSEIVILLGLMWWIARDISYADEQSRTSQRRLETVLANISDQFIFFDKDWRYSFINDRVTEATGKPKEELLGKSLWELFPDVVGTEFEHQARQTMSEQRPVQFEFHYPALNRWFENHFYPSPQGLTMLVTDITDRKRTEQALDESQQRLAEELAATERLQEISTQLIREDNVEALYEQILDAAVAIMSSDYASIQMLYPERGSSGEFRLLGHRGFNPQAAKFWEWVRPSSENICGVVLQTGERAVVFDVRTCDWMAGSAALATYLQTGIHAVQTTPLVSRSGRLVGMISTHWREPHQPSERNLHLLDVLARQAADLIERSQSEEALREADRRKDEFLAMLAHELRNPLAPIRNAAQVLKLAGPAQPEQQWAREVIERQTLHLTRMVEDLLDVSRITQGKITITREPLDLSTIINRAVETSRPLIEARRHQLTIALPPEPVCVEGDLTRLVQVIGNLLNNAAKYTDEGGTIRLETVQEDGEAVIRVRDDGMGLSTDLLPHVFDLFTQADRSLDRSQGGLGIGLTLVRQLVELHGGKVKATSEGPGRGSEFIVRLPVVRIADCEVQNEEASADPRSNNHNPQLRVLVVEDNVDSAEMMAFVLKLSGHETQLAGDGPAALEAARTFQPQVILCDIGLPGMNGYEVAAHLRAQAEFKQTRLIALTGYGQEQDRRRSKEAGFDYHLTKPVDPDQLESLLDSLRFDGQAQQCPSQTGKDTPA